METRDIDKVVTEYRQIVEDFKHRMEGLLQGGFGIGGEALAEEITSFKALPGESYSRDPHVGLKEIREVIGDCHRCPLHASRKSIVFGQGNPKARLLFVGEAPGHEEDLQGEPFVGAAGMLLTRIIRAIDFDRGEVYIANIVKCRPPGNRNPTPEEIETCLPFLMEQIRVIEPWVICAMGAVAAQSLLRSTGKISDLRGKFHDFNGVKLMPTYHPAFLLRNPERKRQVWEDMKAIRREYERLSRKGGQ
jgi:DNA polymerase